MLVYVILGALALFAFPPTATSGRQLLLFGALALVPAAGFAIYALDAGDSVEQGYAFAFAVMAALPAIMGTASRAVSLLAARRGHGRPASLWIEAMGLLLTVLVTATFTGMAGG